MWIAATLSAVIGIVLGLLGGGGAILTLPMLVYAVHVEPRPAIAMSLFVVGATSLVGTAVHARAQSVQWRVGGVFGIAAMAGAFAGGRVARFVPTTVLLGIFAIMMLVTATAMMKGRSANLGPRTLAMGRALGLGLGVGVISGLVGAGGGFLIVPALTIFGGLAMREAVGTSLFVIALQSFAGFLGQVTSLELDWRLLAFASGAAVVGSLVGATLARRVSGAHLRRGFAWLVLAMGLFVISRQASLGVTLFIASATLFSVLVVIRGKHPQSVK